MDELTEKIEEALDKGVSLHIVFQSNGSEWILSMSRREDRV